MKMDMCSETSAKKSDAGESPKERLQHSEHDIWGNHCKGHRSGIYMNKSGTVKYQLTRLKKLYSLPHIIRVTDNDADPSGLSLAGTVGSNPAKGMDVCLL